MQSVRMVSVKDRLPKEAGVYPAFANIKERNIPDNWVDALYAYDPEAGKNNCKWQHVTGFFDNGITHWIELVSDSFEYVEPRRCPECNSASLAGIGSQRVRKCGDCAHEFSWELKEGQKPLVDSSRSGKKK